MTQHSCWQKELHVVELWTPTVCYNMENEAGWDRGVGGFFFFGLSWLESHTHHRKSNEGRGLMLSHQRGALRHTVVTVGSVMDCKSNEAS